MKHYMFQSARSSGALFIAASANQKLSRVDKVPYNGPARDKFPYRPEPRAPYCSSTYVSIDATCPDSCTFKRSPNGEAGGCYVDAGKTVHTIKRLDREAGRLSGDEVIVAEADLISSAFPRLGHVPQDGARGGRDLRLHVGGDTSSEDATRFLGEAATRWRERGGGHVWTYTHRWREVPREAWGPHIAVLASCETASQFKDATDQGYAPAIVVQTHTTRAAWRTEDDRTSVIPCPAETGDRTCVECRLCLEPDALRDRGAGIAFSVHGSHTPRALVNLGIRPKQWRLAI